MAPPLLLPYPQRYDICHRYFVNNLPSFLADHSQLNTALSLHAKHGPAKTAPITHPSHSGAENIINAAKINRKNNNNNNNDYNNNNNNNDNNSNSNNNNNNNNCIVNNYRSGIECVIRKELGNGDFAEIAIDAFVKKPGHLWYLLALSVIDDISSASLSNPNKSSNTSENSGNNDNQREREKEEHGDDEEEEEGQANSDPCFSSWVWSTEVTPWEREQRCALLLLLPDPSMVFEGWRSLGDGMDALEAMRLFVKSVEMDIPEWHIADQSVKGWVEREMEGIAREHAVSQRKERERRKKMSTAAAGNSDGSGSKIDATQNDGHGSSNDNGSSNNKNSQRNTNSNIGNALVPLPKAGRSFPGRPIDAVSKLREVEQKCNTLQAERDALRERVESLEREVSRLRGTIVDITTGNDNNGYNNSQRMSNANGGHGDHHPNGDGGNKWKWFSMLISMIWGGSEDRPSITAVPGPIQVYSSNGDNPSNVNYNQGNTGEINGNVLHNIPRPSSGAPTLSIVHEQQDPRFSGDNVV